MIQIDFNIQCGRLELPPIPTNYQTKIIISSSTYPQSSHHIIHQILKKKKMEIPPCRLSLSFLTLESNGGHIRQ